MNPKRCLMPAYKEKNSNLWYVQFSLKGLDGKFQFGNCVNVFFHIFTVISCQNKFYSDIFSSNFRQNHKKTAYLCGLMNVCYYSNSIVPGGLLVMSYITLLIPFTSLMIRVIHVCNVSNGISAAVAVMKSEVITPLNATA